MRSRQLAPRTALRLQPLEDRAQPSAGALDPTFSGDGLATPGVGFVALDMAVQSDGKVVIVGQGAGRSSTDFALARLNADGSLDTSFGTGGRVTLDFKGKWDQANAVAIQKDGKIVAAGYANVETAGHLHDTAFAIARFHPNGALDTSFGTKGKVLQSFGYGSDMIHDVAVQQDEQIVVAGGTANFGGGNDFIVARYTKAGKPDTAFDGDGIAVTQFGAVDGASALVVQPDGKVVAAGTTNVGGAGDALALARYTPTGALDSEFGTDGKVVTTLPLPAADVLLDAAGNILVGAGQYRLGTQFVVARFLPGGGFDPTFGAGGAATVPNPAVPGPFNLGGIALQPDGKIVAAGTRIVWDAVAERNIDDFAVARLNGTDGSLDPTFGDGGWVVTDFGTTMGLPPSADRTGAVVVMADGRIVTAGESDAGGVRTAGIARYLGDPPAALAAASSGPAGGSGLAAVAPDGWEEVVTGRGRRRR